MKSIEIHIEMPYPYIWAERCHTFGLKDARKLWSDTWDRWDILHGGFHQSSRCISKSSKRPYAQNDPKVTRRAFFSQYSGRVSAQILQNHIGGVFQPIHIRGVSQPIFGACFSPYSGCVSAQEFARPLGLGVFKSCVYVYGHFDRFVLYIFLDKVSGHRPQLANSLRPP